MQKPQRREEITAEVMQKPQRAGRKCRNRGGNAETAKSGKKMQEMQRVEEK
jgi:hypothetical protein